MKSHLVHLNKVQTPVNIWYICVIWFDIWYICYASRFRESIFFHTK